MSEVSKTSQVFTKAKETAKIVYGAGMFAVGVAALFATFEFHPQVAVSPDLLGGSLKVAGGIQRGEGADIVIANIHVTGPQAKTIDLVYERLDNAGKVLSTQNLAPLHLP